MFPGGRQAMCGSSAAILPFPCLCREGVRIKKFKFPNEPNNRLKTKPMPLGDPQAAVLTACDWSYWCNPGWDRPPAETLTYSFDSMGRPASLVDNYATILYQNYIYSNPLPAGIAIQWAQNAQYNAAGRLTRRDAGVTGEASPVTRPPGFAGNGDPEPGNLPAARPLHAGN